MAIAMGSVGRAALQRLADARGTLLPWAPVFLSVGIGGYFGLKAEPSAGFLLLALVTLAGAGWIGWRGPDLARLPCTALALVAGGILLAVLRSHLVGAPVLTFRYYGPVEGRVVDIDRSFSDQVRITLDQVRLEDVPAARRPTRVRIALHGDQMGYQPLPGQFVMLSAHLSRPDGPVEPGGFDFQRLAWFSGLGAVGYTNSPVMRLAEPEGGWALMAFRARMELSKAMQAQIQGQPGAFAAALMTGDRSGVSAQTNAMLRDSNLSHMISISGLHMGLLSGFVFALFRYGLALVPVVTLRVNSKKLAALLALVAATFYMFLAGPDVATRRSYVMAAVMLVAVLADRRALSLRSVAIAALICLGLEPESLVEPGFQMSFGATAALIVSFEYWSRAQERVPKILRPLAVMVLSSLIAGSATTPIAAAHFNRIADYGLIANLLSIPAMGILVMPAGVIAALLAPFGLAAPALWVMEQGCKIIFFIGEWVAGMQGAVQTVPAPPDLFLPLFGLAGATLLLARGWVLRGLSVATLASLAVLWTTAQRPVLLISSDGTLAGVMTAEGRAISKAKGGGFVAKSWLENDGDAADQLLAASRSGFLGDKGALMAEIEGRKIRVFSGKGAAGRAQGACVDNALLVLSEKWAAPSSACEVYDLVRLRKTGAVAFYRSEDGGLLRVTARDWAGQRLWNSAPSRAPADPGS